MSVNVRQRAFLAPIGASLIRAPPIPSAQADLGSTQAQDIIQTILLTIRTDKYDCY